MELLLKTMFALFLLDILKRFPSLFSLFHVKQKYNVFLTCMQKKRIWFFWKRNILGIFLLFNKQILLLAKHRGLHGGARPDFSINRFYIKTTTIKNNSCLLPNLKPNLIKKILVSWHCPFKGMSYNQV